MVVVRDSEKVVGVLPLRPREVVVAGGVLTANYCTAVRVAEGHRSRGLGSAMLDAAEAEFCGPTSFICVVRSNPKSAAYNWYRKNGFVAASDVSSYDVSGNDLSAGFDLGDLAISELETTEDSISNAIDGILVRASIELGEGALLRSVDSWKRELRYHYYSDLYSRAQASLCGQKGRSLVGLVAYTEMRTEPRFDVLDFEYEDPKWFMRLSDLVVRHYSAKYGVPVRWNLSRAEGQQLGVESQWVERWRTYFMIRLHSRLQSDQVARLYSARWRYRQLDFV